MTTIRKNPTLSEDLISEILIRVPVKSLLCFQSVCKNWLSLIKQPAFVKSQFLRTVKTLTDQTFIMYRFLEPVETEWKFYLLSSSRQIVADLKFQEFESVGLVGSANGIVCVVHYCLWIRESKIYICLWNPAIRQSKVIPDMRQGAEVIGLGFGYDLKDQDYKFLRIVKFESPHSLSAVVFSDNMNTWRMLPHPIDHPSGAHFHVCVNGFLCGTGKLGMMAFDLNKEVLNCAI